MSHGPKGKSSRELREIGKDEAEEVDLDAPFMERLLAEVKNYGDEYGIPSLEDVVTEINSRGKDLEFQGELTVYSTQNREKIRRGLDELVKEGKLRRVKVPGHKAGYALMFRTRTRGRSRGKRYPIRRGTFTYGKSMLDLTAEDL